MNFAVFADLVASGDNRHFLVRMRRNLKVHELEELDDGSVLAELRPNRHYKQSGLELPDAIRGRVVAFQFPDGEPSRLFTTLLDPQAHPADELIELYHERWEIELAYDELKTHMLNRREALRSKKPDGIAQEIWGMLLLYNLVRREMLDVAHQNDLPPKRVSFWSSLLWMRNFWENQAWRSRPGTIPKSLAEFRSNLTTLINPPRRSDRRFPRHVKIKMSNYKRNRGRRKPIEESEERPK